MTLDEVIAKLHGIADICAPDHDALRAAIQAYGDERVRGEREACATLATQYHAGAAVAIRGREVKP